ncbi:DUF616 domain-containing protein [archaeon]|nr:MAG: DUF616 domain-containing protein [archaeon]
MNVLITLTVLVFYIVVCDCWNEAISYNHSVFPCEAGCASNAPCFPTDWTTIAETSKALTEKCEYVLYSIALGNKDTLKVITIEDFWDGKTCSIFFLSSHSKFAHIHKLDTGSRFRNWTIIGVESSTLDQAFGSNRRAAKVVKMSPHYFLHPNVKYAIFIDAKLQVVANPIDVIKTHMEPYNDVILAALRHPFSTSFSDEFRTISRIYHVYKNTAITDNFHLLAKQVKAYNESALMRSDFVQIMIEGGYQAIKVHDEVSQQFRCAWLNQVQQYADRDQVSFPYVLGWMTHGNMLEPGSRNNSFLSLRDEATGVGGRRRVNLLNSSVYWWKTEGTRLAKQLTYQELMQFK